jgi:hypothetical protein
MSKKRRWTSGRVQPSKARRPVGGWIGLLALLGGLALVALETFAGDLEVPRSRPAALAVPYHDGPVDSVPVRAPQRPAGVDELLGLSVLAAILCGLRVSGLGRASRSQ